MAANQLWRWRALTKEGEFQSGTLWATDRTAAFTRLMRSDLHPLALTRCAQRHRWRPHHCCEMFRQLATLLQAGLTLSHSLQMLAEQHPLKPWQALLQSIADELSEGSPFSESLKKWPEVFSPLHVSMVKTGELTGKLEECCRQLARQQKAQQQLREKVKKALRYPAIVLTIAVLVVLAMVILVLPEFAAIYKTFNTPLPMLTQMVMGMAAFIQSYALALFVALLMPLAAAWALRQNPRWQRMLMHMPVMGALAKGQKLGHIFTVLSLTQQAGIPFLQGLESAEETVESCYWRGILHSVREDIEKGLPVWSSFQKAAIFTPLCIQLLRTGEMSGALDIMLANLARHHTEQTFQRADNLAALLEPVLLIVTGVIIGTLVVAMYLPIFHLGDAMSAG
ncbi:MULTISPECIES: protein transport protein HofC [Enterobacter]|uniref:Protein transport protein HofC n=1 Tax=Enterobacter dykesii TaxID=2797506 RepID=A0AAU7J3P2_9ENTR|nr:MULTISPECIES: protein transport protein HofC [Enterobacter]KAA0527906.1 protein transport protein HofC [Enterobacter asburiae]KAA0534936.1 protein transport protein HofC [Enterobacter dykesii]MCV3772581.1 protein transport protein HofC [Enterobacter sp. RD4-1-1]RTN80998.1 type IV pilin biogenesis protein [Enterobacter asburiae]RTP79993.1 type IV pilin biogenesis protein [Enterobacter asburiae]